MGAFLAFLARSGALLGRLLGFMDASDLILGGFGEGLGRIWRGFGEGFAKVLEDFGKIYFDFLNWDPRAASLRPAERHNTRGSRAPRVLDGTVQVVPCLLAERSSSERASRIPSGRESFLLWEAKLAPSWLQDRIFLRSFRKMLQSCVF